MHMKLFDCDNYDVVKAGKEFLSDCTINLQHLLSVMEKNETYIFWLQPKNSDINSQVACIKINGVFYNLNLKMEKIIFRHIRLTKNFVNQERLEDGTPKLRIPHRLLKEKLRTALRAQQVHFVKHQCVCIKELSLCVLQCRKRSFNKNRLFAAKIRSTKSKRCTWLRLKQQYSKICRQLELFPSHRHGSTCANICGQFCKWNIQRRVERQKVY